MGVVVVGSLNRDLVVRVPHPPAVGERVLGTALVSYLGGKGANQAVAAARAGAPTALIGRVGPDDAGRQLTAELAEAGVDVGWVGVCRHDPTGTALITVGDHGENTIAVVPGANAMLRDVHVGDAAAAGVFGPGSVLLAQLEVPVAAVAEAVRRARAAGATVVLNAAPALALPADVLVGVDYLIVNEVERQFYQPVPDGPMVVETLGARGARMGGVEVAAHAVAVLDTTGAGDAFCGAFAAALAVGRAPQDALAFANAAGALACTRAGAVPSMPSAAEVAALLAPRR